MERGLYLREERWVWCRQGQFKTEKKSNFKPQEKVWVVKSSLFVTVKVVELRLEGGC